MKFFENKRRVNLIIYSLLLLFFVATLLKLLYSNIRTEEISMFRVVFKFVAIAVISYKLYYLYKSNS